MDLKDPSKKMSKSSEVQSGVIRMLDDPDVIRKKIMGATTDSDNEIKFDLENKPGISNLINIYVSLSDLSISEVEDKFKNNNYGEFKKEVSDLVINHLLKIQAKYNELINSNELDRIIDEGREKTLKMAKQKYDLVKEKVGLGR